MGPMPLDHYWDVNYEAKIIPLVLTGSDKKYLLNKSDSVIKSAKRLVAISHRIPNALGYTLDGKKLVTSSIYDATILNLRDIDGAEVITMPLSNINNRSGGDNNILMLPTGVDIDFQDGKSFLEIHAPTATVTTAVSNTEAYELVLYFERDC